MQSESSEAQTPPRDGGAKPSGAPARSTPVDAPSRCDDPSAAGGAASQLRVSEIFYSLQGESRNIGLPTVFILLTRCPLRCTYCDTTYAFTGGQNMSVEEILENIAGYKARYVTVTGGDPLSQKN